MYCKSWKVGRKATGRERINSSKVYCKYWIDKKIIQYSFVLIVAKCIVNDAYDENVDKFIDVLIVAKCIVNTSKGEGGKNELMY